MDESGGGAVPTEEEEHPPVDQQAPRTQEDQPPPAPEVLAYVRQLILRATLAMEQQPQQQPPCTPEEEQQPPRIPEEEQSPEDDDDDDSSDDSESSDYSSEYSDDDASDSEEIDDDNGEGLKTKDTVTLPKMEIDDMNCSICMAPWTNGGDHQVSCLPCGHLFGACCIQKWLKHCKSSKKCPQCNQECSLKDVRVIYAPQIVVVDHELQKKVESLESKCASLEKKVHDLAGYEVIMDKLRVLETNTKEFHTEMNKNHAESMEVQTRFLKLVEDDYRVRRLQFPGFYVNKPPYIPYKSSSSTPSGADPSK